MSQTIDDIKKEILSKLNLQAEFQSFGISLKGNPSSKGWIKCPSPFNPDKLPSCGVCVDNSSSYAGYLRIFNSSGPRQAIGFFDLAAELNPACSGREFIEILKYYADKTGVEFDIKSKKKSSAPKGKVIATYDYRDLSGDLIYQVCRLKPKSFRQRRPDPNKPDKWIWNMQGISALPYNISKVVDNKAVYIVEGEKCADDLIEKFNLPATTFPGGAGKIYPEILPYFKDKHIILLPDNDTPGREHMQRLAHVFQDTTASVKIVELPDLEPKGDISNWIASGGTKNQLLKLCKNAKDVEATEDPIDELNESHAVVRIGSKVRILDETIDIKGKSDIQFLSDYDFRLLYANRKVPNPFAGLKGQSKNIPLANAWLNSPKRREYKGIIFEPQITTNKFYNLYKGLSYTPQKGDWSLFKSHILENICSDEDGKSDMQNFDWLIAWLARIVQAPGSEKPGTAIVLRGDRGTGKGVFAEIFGQIFGHHFLQITNSKQVTGRFNSHLKDCILLYVDEAWFAGDKSSESVLKGLITSSEHAVEFKGKDVVMMSNHVNLIIASNNDWVVPAGDKERRFFVLDVGTKHIQDHTYFEAISNQMYHKDGISAMLYDLLHIDISKYNLRQVLKTKGLLDQRINSFDSFEKFWYEILLSGYDINEDEGIIKSKFYDKYIDFCKKINTKYIMTPAIFGKNLVKYCNIDVQQKIGIDGKRTRFIYFPDKNECKKSFVKQIGQPIPWKKIEKSRAETEVDNI